MENESFEILNADLKHMAKQLDALPKENADPDFIKQLEDLKRLTEKYPDDEIITVEFTYESEKD